MATLVLLNKPFNTLCQFTDKEGRTTLSDFVDTPNVYPAGRLDYDSEGLVLLTDDGELQHQISHPAAKLTKVYWVQVEGSADHTLLEPLRKGVTLKDGPCRPAKVKVIDPPQLWERNPPVRERQAIPTSWLEITISEGRNRQIRRMTAAIGFPTLRLVRVKIGNWSLGELQPGQSIIQSIHSAAKTHKNPARTRKKPPRSKLQKSKHSKPDRRKL